MPGIVGIIEKRFSEDNANALQTMLKSMVNEDFYTSGILVDDKLGFRFGWVCHKDSFSDCLPIWNENKDICLLFVGEDAKDESEIAGLTAQGHKCRTDKADYLVHQYEEEGAGFLQKINGGFSGILVDFRQERILLFNDRFGLSRLYYHENEKGFYFSSEAKSLLKILPDLRRFDYSSLGEFFSCGCVLENKTLFSGVLVIPGGSLWIFTPGGGTERGAYFQRDTWENQTALSEAVYYERLKEMLALILPRYFRRGERPAISLTGGVGSRMIMAWAPCPPFRVPCYTYGGIYRDSTDVIIARRVARICQQHHETIAVKRNFFSEFPALAKRTVYYTDGTMDVSGAADLYVNKQAREIAPVRVTGNFGDQVLRRIIGFKPLSLHEQIFDKEFYHRIQKGLATYTRMSRKPDLSFLAFQQIPWHHYPLLALENTQSTMQLPFLDNDLLSLVYQAPSESTANLGLSLQLIFEGLPALGRLPTDRGRTYKPIPVITSIRRLFLEFASQAEYAYDYAMPQWLAKLDFRLSTLHLEKYFLGRKNYSHFRIWYKGELANYVKDILLDPKTLDRPYLNGEAIESIVNKHLAGYANYTREIHSLLTSELIQRHLLKSAEC